VILVLKGNIIKSTGGRLKNIRETAKTEIAEAYGTVQPTLSTYLKKWDLVGNRLQKV
jgi:isocitrate dehydrogenase